MEFKNKTIKELISAFDSNELSSYQLTSYYLKRINDINEECNSVLELNPLALNEARVLDEERSNNKIRSKVHGLCVLLKDNISTLYPLHTTAGSYVLKDHYSKIEATIVTKLKEAGVVILGKTNLSEWANFLTQDMKNGYSSLGGEVLNPHNKEADPFGSSTGSAVAAYLGLSTFTVGTETGGSIISPSWVNGVVGLKPTIGLVSRDGIIPISSTLDTSGPICKTVEQATYLLEVLSGKDDISKNIPSKVEYTKYLKNESLQGKRILVIDHHETSPFLYHEETFKNTVAVLGEDGATIIKDLDISEEHKIWDVMRFEFKELFSNYMKNHINLEHINSLEDVVKENNKNKEICLKYGQSVFLHCQNETSGFADETEYIDALKDREVRIKELEDIFINHNIDMIYFSSYSTLGPYCGFPSMTIPLNKDENNVPIGGYFLANRFHEHNLIEILYRLEYLLKQKTQE